jgi:hypothetical protein
MRNWRLWHLFLLLQLCLVVAIAAATAPVDTIGFEAVDLYPHGFEWDAKNNRFLVGSSGSGAIISVSGEDGEVEEFVTDDGYAAKAGVMGVVVDRNLNRVLVAVQDVEAWGFSGVAAYDLDTKERIYFTRLDQLGVGEGTVGSLCSFLSRVDSVLCLFGKFFMCCLPWESNNTQQFELYGIQVTVNGRLISSISIRSLGNRRC